MYVQLTLNPLYKDTSIYRTAYCGPSGVLITEGSLYRTAYCGPSGVLTIEGSLNRMAYTVVPVVAQIQRFHCIYHDVLLCTYIYIYIICIHMMYYIILIIIMIEY